MKTLIPSHRARRTAIATFVLVVVCVSYYCRDAILSSAGDWLNVGSPLVERVDEVMVLGGDASTRPFVAAAIFRAGLASQVLILQTAESEESGAGLAPPHHEVIRQVLIRSGVSPDAIVLLPTTVDSTEQEAQCLADFLEKHPGHSVAVVTSDFHTRRTRLLFARACRQHVAQIHFIGAPTDGFNFTDWWRVETGFVHYINEYLKLAKALAR